MALGRGRAVWTLALVFSLLGVQREARAQARHPVLITSDPPGATIYFDVGEEGMIESTPYRGRLPAGKYSVVFELDGYSDKIVEFQVKKKRKTQRLRAKMEEYSPAFLRVEVRPPGLEGVVIRIDEEARKVGEDRFELTPGTHCVEVVQKELGPFTKCLELAAGQKKKLVVTLTEQGGDPLSDCPDPDDPACETCPDPDNPLCESVPVEPEEPLAPVVGHVPSMFRIEVGPALGGRRFRFSNPQGDLRPFTAGGLLAARGALEVYPLASSPSGWLRFLGLFVGGLYALPFDSTTPGTAAGSIPTKWWEFDTGVRLGTSFGDTGVWGIELGFGIQRFEFDDGDGEPLTGVDSEVPGVRYQYVRAGARVEGDLFEKVRGHAVASYRKPSEVGDLKRLGGASANGFSLVLGARRPVFSLMEVGLLGHLDVYKLSFGNQANGAGQAASGGTDVFFGLSLTASFVK